MQVRKRCVTQVSPLSGTLSPLSLSCFLSFSLVSVYKCWVGGYQKNNRANRAVALPPLANGGSHLVASRPWHKFFNELGALLRLVLAPSRLLPQESTDSIPRLVPRLVLPSVDSWMTVPARNDELTEIIPTDETSKHRTSIKGPLITIEPA